MNPVNFSRFGNFGETKQPEPVAMLTQVLSAN